MAAGFRTIYLGWILCTLLIFWEILERSGLHSYKNYRNVFSVHIKLAPQTDKGLKSYYSLYFSLLQP